MTTILRLMGEADQRLALEQAVGAVRGGTVDARVFTVDPASFRLVPGAPFAYWVSSALLQLFGSYPPFSGKGTSIKQGLATADDFRFLRVYWEVSRLSGKWHGMAKGGSFSRFYAAVYLVANWLQSGHEIRGNLNAHGGIRSNIWMLKETASQFFLRPGLTWPLRTNGLSFRSLPAGCIFGHKGPAAFGDGDEPTKLLALCTIVNSAAFGMFVSIQLARTELAQSYEVGLIQQTPVPDLTPDQQSTLAALARCAWSLQRQLDTVSEASHAFHLPARLQALRWGWNPNAMRAELAQIQAEIDTRAFDLYGFSPADRLAAQAAAGGPATPDTATITTDQDDAEEAEEAPATVADPANDWAAVASWAIGVAFGRFDVRLAQAGSTRPAEPEPFDPLPACSPGMLAGPAGQPAREAPADYPLPIPADGILVDDAGHDLDLIGRIRHIFDLIFTTEADARWSEAAAALDPKSQDLRAWLRREAFGLHLKAHSKSRRKAPLYWPLSTSSGQFTVWIYAHRVTADTLFAINDRLVKPKTEAEALKLARMTADAGANPSGRQRSELEDQEILATELRDFRDDLTNLAPLLRPLFDDGIVLWSSPLWPLITIHSAWQKELRTAWAALAAGDYEWAQLAMRLWPDRVIPKCSTDRSLAIAHDLEAVFWHQDASEAWKPTIVSAADLARLIADRQNPAVTAARDWLLSRTTERPASRRKTAATPAPSRPAKTKAERPARIARIEHAIGSSPAVDAKLLARLADTIATFPDGAGKSEILASAGIAASEWNQAISVLLDTNQVTRSGEKRGTTYMATRKTST